MPTNPYDLLKLELLRWKSIRGLKKLGKSESASYTEVSVELCNVEYRLVSEREGTQLSS